MDGERDRLRRRPQPRPVRGRERQTHAVPGRDRLRDAVELEHDALAAARLERLRVFVAVPMREVQDAAGDQQRAAIDRDVAEPRGELRNGPVALELELHARVPEQLDALVERGRGEAERTAVVRALVHGALAVGAVRAPDSAVDAAEQVRAELEPRCGGVGLVAESAFAEPHAALADRGRRPGALGHPAAGPLHLSGGRRHGLLHPDAEGGLVHDPGVLALEPLVPPAQALLEEADRRSGLDLVRERVRPRADQALRGRFESGQEPQNRLGVAVRPAADRVDGATDRAEVLADRALLPVVVTPLVAEPLVLVRLDAVDPLEPGIAPARARDLRVGGDCVEREQRRPPREHLERQHSAAAVVHVVRVTVVRGAEADHGLQLRRAAGRHLEPVEAAPGDPEHPDGARAPGLLRDPSEHLHRVLLLLG